MIESAQGPAVRHAPLVATPDTICTTDPPTGSHIRRTECRPVPSDAETLARTQCRNRYPYSLTGSSSTTDLPGLHVYR